MEEKHLWNVLFEEEEKTIEWKASQVINIPKESVLPVFFISRKVHLSMQIPLGKLLFCKCSQNLFDIHPFCKGIHSVLKSLESRIHKRKRHQTITLKVGFSKQKNKYWLGWVVQKNKDLGDLGFCIKWRMYGIFCCLPKVCSKYLPEIGLKLALLAFTWNMSSLTIVKWIEKLHWETSHQS